MCLFGVAGVEDGECLAVAGDGQQLDIGGVGGCMLGWRLYLPRGGARDKARKPLPGTGGALLF